MNPVKLILIFTLFMSAFSYSQDSIVQLPNFEKTKYSKKLSTRVLMAKMVDELGYKYYWATDSLLNDEIGHTFHSRNLPRLLLNVVYQMSEAIANSISSQKTEKRYSIEETSFEALRKNTLLNLKEASNNLIKNSETPASFNMNSLIISTSIADSYCDKIILYREYIGKPFGQKNNSREKAVHESIMFERNLGGDGLTIEQWIEISRYSKEKRAGFNYFKIMRHQRRVNTNIIVKLRKQEKARIEVGKLEQIELYSNVVEDLTYTYFGNPPKKLSILYSYDDELVKGIINWIIYINSGNPTQLNKIFTMGFGIIISIDKNNQGQLSFNNVNYRDVIDKVGNKVRLEYSEEYFDGTSFSDITITEVHINKNNQIEFISQAITEDHTHENPQSIVFLLKNIEGILLKRIKVIIDQIRNDENSYNDDYLNLRKY